MCEQPIHYTPGTWVWAKLMNRIWWPGKIADLSSITDELMYSKRVKENAKTAVYFEGTKSYEIVINLNQLYPYSCVKKLEFIEKGYWLYIRQKNKGLVLNGDMDMGNFIGDVLNVENMIGGNTSIFDQFFEKKQTEKKTNISKVLIRELFMTDKERQKKEREKNKKKRKVNQEHEPNVPASSLVPSGSGSGGSSINVALKNKKRSSSYSSSSDSSQSSEIQHLPSTSFEIKNQQPQSGVPPLTSPETNIYKQSLRMHYQPVPVQHSVRSVKLPDMIDEREVSMDTNVSTSGDSVKTFSSMSPLLKSVATNRNFNTNNNMGKPSWTVKSESFNKLTKQEITIKEVSTLNIVSLPTGHSSNSNISLRPTSSSNIINNLPAKVSHNSVSQEGGTVNSLPFNNTHATVSCNSTPQKIDSFVDLTGDESEDELKNEPKMLFSCKICLKKYPNNRILFEHISTAHESILRSHNCNLCSQDFPNETLLNNHKTSFHKVEVNFKIPFGIPIIDMNQPHSVADLQAIGITSYMPVVQQENLSGNFGVPIMNISKPNAVKDLKFINFISLGCITKI